MTRAFACERSRGRSLPETVPDTGSVSAGQGGCVRSGNPVQTTLAETALTGIAATAKERL